MWRIDIRRPYELRFWPFGLDHKTVAHIQNNGRKMHVLNLKFKNEEKEIENLENGTFKIVFTDLPDKSGNAYVQIVSSPHKGKIISLKIKD